MPVDDLTPSVAVAIARGDWDVVPRSLWNEYEGRELVDQALLVLAGEVDRLATENANLRTQLDGHRREAMIRDVAHLTLQGPCRPDEFGDPHDFRHVPKSDSLDRCVRCGWVIGK